MKVIKDDGKLKFFLEGRIDSTWENYKRGYWTFVGRRVINCTSLDAA